MTHTWNQRLTVTLDTPWGPRTGSSVTAVRWEEQRGPLVPPDAPKLLQDVTGEAVVVDVRPDAPEGSPRYLFVLLDVSGLAPGVMAPDGLKAGEKVRAMRRVRGPVAVPPESLPRMVTFRDVNDPTSVVRIELTKVDGIGERPEPRPGNWRSYEPSTTLAEAFGAGVRLGSATIEVVEEQVTDGVMNELLGWLGPYSERALGPQQDPTNPSVHRVVEYGDFVKNIR